MKETEQELNRAIHGQLKKLEKKENKYYEMKDQLQDSLRDVFKKNKEIQKLQQKLIVMCEFTLTNPKKYNTLEMQHLALREVMAFKESDDTESEAIRNELSTKPTNEQMAHLKQTCEWIKREYKMLKTCKDNEATRHIAELQKYVEKVSESETKTQLVKDDLDKYKGQAKQVKEAYKRVKQVNRSLLDKLSQINRVADTGTSLINNISSVQPQDIPQKDVRPAFGHEQTLSTVSSASSSSKEKASLSNQTNEEVRCNV
ncbi:hypothetical protein RFI_17092 [Reticulomyxa filosa]|uniref:Uncharacterized protein n=1 Tax=Reticulomyxa filosa TaxID=46433 RepID=X6N304_RETFI|nr:hypothetical protein RFI_17092 [Reticulomyxa filosa]|eukprot:ETO20124.1 hypothetical protein RFI_17092 [Reticulomyxa filosa]